MTDIVERLRPLQQWFGEAREAADEIERLRSECLVQSECIETLHGDIDRLRELLREGLLTGNHMAWSERVREVLNDE